MPEQSFDSFIFCIFPVHLLEGNRALSMLFSLVLNLGFGMLLAVALHVTSTVSFGQYFHLVYGCLLLPLLPSVSRQEFMSSMTLSSLWKYCLFGVFLITHCAASTSRLPRLIHYLRVRGGGAHSLHSVHPGGCSPSSDGDAAGTGTGPIQHLLCVAGRHCPHLFRHLQKGVIYNHEH